MTFLPDAGHNQFQLETNQNYFDADEFAEIGPQHNASYDDLANVIDNTLPGYTNNVTGYSGDGTTLTLTVVSGQNPAAASGAANCVQLFGFNGGLTPLNEPYGVPLMLLRVLCFHRYFGGTTHLSIQTNLVTGTGSDLGTAAMWPYAEDYAAVSTGMGGAGSDIAFFQNLDGSGGAQVVNRPGTHTPGAGDRISQFQTMNLTTSLSSTATTIVWFRKRMYLTMVLATKKSKAPSR